MITYKLYTEGPEKTPAKGIKRLPDGALIPEEPLNRDWREYQHWLAKGNTPEPADE